MRHAHRHLLLSLIGGAALAAGLLAAPSILQAPEAEATQDSPPGDLVLLEGYRHERRQGADTLVGRITKEHGPTFRYDIGQLAGPRVRNVPQDDLVWQRRQRISGREVLVAQSLHGDAIVSILRPDQQGDARDLTLEERAAASLRYPANFYGRVESEEQLADLLLMVLTYAPEADALQK